MLLKLLLPPIDRQIHGGSIATWHKTDGQWVDYGDDICDLAIALRVSTRPERSRTEIVRALTSRLQVTARDFMLTHEGVPRAVFTVRLTSSDAGIMRKIVAQPGTNYESGDVLAILSSQEQEPLPATDEALRNATIFRVVPNFI